ncbi:acireductone dioxygenase [Parasteatoda tepidariorum]|uniref:acireductone dioxygenase n=1 Tax=Parasteatoda tepidariorum TaxID=114398 RepID=UPI00077FB2F1|nr:1,2-dihydroxy-3-keto-5-methylthiopentene dioxygenase-like [Parasteatoda tepidariorum]
MPQAWYIDDAKTDPQSEHHLNPPQFIEIERLYSLCGVEHWKVDVDSLQCDEEFKKVRKDRGYDWDDQVEVSRGTLPNYDATIKKFYTEHLHEDEEIRLFLAGSGYFDVRDKNDKWIRIKAEKGDLLVLPAGIYHRFTTDATNYAKVMRLFCGNPVWTAIDRPADDNPSRLKYLKTISAMN